MPDGTVANAAGRKASGFLNRLPPEIVAGLTPEQRDAIETAAGERSGPRPPVNIRISLPLPGWRCYLAVIAGRERRSRERRDADRENHPLNTAGNFLFILGGAMVFYILVLLAFLMNSSVLTY